ALAATAAALGAHAALARRRTLDCRGKLARAARALRHLMGVRYVVLGHSHGAVCEPLGDEAWYFNSGSWLDSMRYVLILRDGPARLCEWPGGFSSEEARKSAEGRRPGSDSLLRGAQTEG